MIIRAFCFLNLIFANMESSITAQVISALHSESNFEKAAFLSKFFKSGSGDYGEGDKFLGVKVGAQRKVAKKFVKEIDPNEIGVLLMNEYHEVRLTALFMLIGKYQKSKTEGEKASWVNVYLTHLDGVNNWDLVDSSAEKILGNWLMDKDKSLLSHFAVSGNLWRQRIAIMSTFYFIKQGAFGSTLEIAELLLKHPHDLIHKAVGWMLREVANRDHHIASIFLKQHYKAMPRTMLRYAIEKFDPETRKAILTGNWGN